MRYISSVALKLLRTDGMLLLLLQCYEVLSDAMTSLKGIPSPSGPCFEAVHTTGRLYWEFDLHPHEWWVDSRIRIQYSISSYFPYFVLKLPSCPLMFPLHIYSETNGFSWNSIWTCH